MEKLKTFLGCTAFVLFWFAGAAALPGQELIVAGMVAAGMALTVAMAYVEWRWG